VELLVKTLELVEVGGARGYDPTDAGVIIGEALEASGEPGWHQIASYLSGDSWRVRMDLRGWITDYVDHVIVTDWIGGDLERARIAASVCRIGIDDHWARAAVKKDDDASSPSVLVRYLLQHFGNDEEVRSSLFGEFDSGGWSGNESDRIARQIRQLESWVSSDEPAGVKTWARDAISSLQRSRVRALEREAEERY
jgi:hypothetical protein